MTRGSRDIEAQMKQLGLQFEEQPAPAPAKKQRVVELLPEQDLERALRASLPAPTPAPVPAPAPAPAPAPEPKSPWLAPDGRTWPSVLGRGLSAAEVERLHKTGSPLDPTKKFPRPSKTPGWWEVAPGEFSSNIGAWIKE
jgi:hypothetical protein